MIPVGFFLFYAAGFVLPNLTPAAREATKAADKAWQEQIKAETEAKYAGYYVDLAKDEVAKAEEARDQAYAASAVVYGNFMMQTTVNRLGLFDNGRKQGYNLRKYPDDEWYIGDYKDDLRTGYGLARYMDGSIVSGQWQENRISGYALIVYVDGSYYAGQWKEGYCTGYAVKMRGDGQVFSRWFNDFELNGNGRLDKTSKDKNLYTNWGQFTASKLTGYGMIEYSTAEYLGFHNDDEFKGVRIITHRNPKKDEVLYQEANYQIYVRTDAVYYAGEWENYILNGYGVIRFANGDYYAGQVKNDVRDGFGILYNEKNNVIARGTWKADEYKGR